MLKTSDVLDTLTDESNIIVIMALDSLPYTAANFNSIPNIMDSAKQFKEANVSGHLMQEIGQAFLKHHVNSSLGVALVHRHFDLAQHEMLVNIGNVAVPWNTHDDVSGLANPSSWCFTKDGVMPYEFTYGGVKVPLDDHLGEFLSEYHAILEKNHASHILGLCTLDGVPADGDAPTMEFTSGRANITLPFDVNPSEGGATEAMWQIQRGMSRNSSPC